jgi:elongation factor G
MKPLEKIRNIGIAAHIDAGKTTTTERILFFTGVKHRIGEVDNGSATMDFMKQEQERGITIASAAITCEWNDHQINIIDTPGHIDFTVEVERSLRVLDGMIAVFCAVGGVEPQSETVWKQAAKYNVPRIIFVNKMDRLGADFEECVKMIHDRLSGKACVFQIPVGQAESFVGIIDLVKQKMITYKDSAIIEEEIPKEYIDIVKDKRLKLVETLADFDDQLMQKYLDGKEIEENELKLAARKATCNSSVFPVVCGSAFTNKGIQLLLDAVCDYLPNPIDRGEINGIDLKNTKNLIRKPDIEDYFSALAFKIINDPFVGQQTFIRIYSGKLTPGTTIYNCTKQHKERVGRILRIHAKDRLDIESASSGDIVALIGMKQTTTGDTMADIDQPILFEKIFVPQQVVSLHIKPKEKSDEEKLGMALSRLSLEDPSLSVKYNEETSETIISGMGELHLEIIVDRLKHEFSVDSLIGPPAVAYKETVTKETLGEKKYAKQSGGKGQYGHVKLKIEPNREKGFEFVDSIRGGNIPREYIPAIRKGIEEAMVSGIYAKYPVVDVKVTILDGSFHEVDSSELAFKIAGSLAFKEAFGGARPILLEPIMKIEINTPDEYLGSIIADFTKRRGKIEELRRFRKGSQKIDGVSPLASMFGYATALRTLSSGRANYSMEFSRYDPLPHNLTLELLKKKELENK